MSKVQCEDLNNSPLLFAYFAANLIQDTFSMKFKKSSIEKGCAAAVGGPGQSSITER